MRLFKENPGSKIAVMNFANAFHAGGGVTKGSSALLYPGSSKWELSAFSFAGRQIGAWWSWLSGITQSPRAVPYKDCGSVYDEGWLDEICTENRDWDE